MDHIPLPQNPTIGNKLKIPFLITEEYDGGEFSSYMTRNRWETLTNYYEIDCAIFKLCGVKASPRELGCMLQNWLFLGNIWAILGLQDGPITDIYSTFAKSSNFRGTSGAGTAVLDTTKLDERLVLLMQLYVLSKRFITDFGAELSSEQRLERYILRMLECFKTSHRLIAQVMISPKYSDREEVQLVCLSIALLIEHLNHLLHVIDILQPKHDPVHVGDVTHGTEPAVWGLFKSNYMSGVLGIDPGKIIQRRMMENGWCQHEIASIHQQDSHPHLTGLWFFANINPPLSDKSHKNCTIEFCKHSITPRENYKQVHQSAGCQCNLTGLNPDELQDIVDQDGLPLVQIQVNPALPEAPPKVSALLAKPSSKFLAISHVWQDGHGNHHENKLPECFIKELWKISRHVTGGASDAACMPVWMDTLCVPRKPETTKRKALRRLKDPFEMAQHVVVLDAYLAQIKSKELFIGDLVARILSSRWVRRLWTYQEGILAKRLWFQFKDGIIDISPRMRQLWGRNGLCSPTVAEGFINRIIRDMYGASKIITSDDIARDPIRNLKSVRHSLSSRMTSVESDEALCLATIFDVDTNPIVNTPEGEKMKLFWLGLCQSGQLPLGIVFSKACNKLTTKGYRWAPSTMMGPARRHPWVSYLTEQASLCDSGLLVFSFRSLKLQSSISLSRDPYSFASARARVLKLLRSSSSTITHDTYNFRHLMLLRHEAAHRYYWCQIEEPWHQVPSSFGQMEEFSFLINPEKDVGSKNNSLNIMSGVTASHEPYTKSSTRPISANLHSHVQIMIFPSHVNHYLEYVFENVDRYFTTNKHLRSKDPDETYNQFFEKHGRNFETMFETFVRLQGTEACAAFNKSLGLPEDDISIEYQFLFVACKIGYLWPCIEVVDTGKEFWCLD